MKRIVYTTNEGTTSVIIPSGNVEDCIKDVPLGVEYHIVDTSTIPSDRTFRNAWIYQDGIIDHDIDMCKCISHEKRRAARTKEFAPLDIKVTIPSEAVQAEADRQAIREKYATIQEQIDVCIDVSSLKDIIVAEGL